MAAPSVRAVGAMSHGLAAITPVAPASHVSGDIEYLLVESDNGTTCTLSTAAGFAAVTGGQAVVGTGPSTSSATMTLFWRRWNGSDGNPTVADTGNHQSAFIVAIQNAIASGTPHEAVTTSTQASPGTGGTASGGTTAGADRLVLIAVSQAAPDADADPSADLSGWTNANLTSITEQKEYSCADGNGGLGALTTGVKATAGAIGNTTFTSVQTSNASSRAMVTLAVQPVAGAQLVTPGVLALTLSTFAPTIAHQIVAGLATLATAMFAPVIKLQVTPPTTALTLATFAPNVAATANQVVTPATLALTTATFAPTVLAPRLVTPITTALRLSEYERLLPDAIVSATGFAGAVLAEFLAEDADYADASSTSAAIRLSFPTPSSTPSVGAISRVEALIHAGTTDTSATVEYHQSGTLVVSSGSVVVPANTSVLVGVDIPNASITDAAGGQARITLNVVGSGVDIVRWLVNSGLVPTVAATANQVATPAALALTTAAFAPAVSTPRLATPPPLALSTAAFAPAVTASDHKIATPSPLAAALAAFAPVVTASDHKVATPPALSAAVASFVPSVAVSDHKVSTPTTLSVAIASFAPTAATSDHQTATPPTASLTTSAFAPTVSTTAHQVATPPTLGLLTATFAPTVALSDNQAVTPGVAALSTATFAPTISASAHVTAAPDTAALVTATFAPVVTASEAGTFIPGTATLTLTRFAPDVTAVANQVATPSTAVLALTALAPSILSGETVTTDPGSLAITTFAPDVATTAHLRVEVSTVPLALTRFAPDAEVTGAVSVVVGGVALTITTYPPDVIAGPGIFSESTSSEVGLVGQMAASVAALDGATEVALVPIGSAEVGLR